MRHLKIVGLLAAFTVWGFAIAFIGVWYAMVECLQRVLEFLDRASYGIEVWPYPAGNNTALEQTKAAAFSWQAGDAM